MCSCNRTMLYTVLFAFLPGCSYPISIIIMNGWFCWVLSVCFVVAMAWQFAEKRLENECAFRSIAKPGLTVLRPHLYGISVRLHWDSWVLNVLLHSGCIPLHRGCILPHGWYSAAKGLYSAALNETVSLPSV